MNATFARHLRVKIGLVTVVFTLLLGLFVHPPFSAAQNSDITGDYTVTLVRLQIPTDVANGNMLVGRWRISFADDQTYTAERLDLGVLVSGTYSTDGDKLTVVDESGLLSCSNPAASTGGIADVSTGSYSYKLDKGNLKLTTVDDGCALRRVLFTTSDFSTYIACTTIPLTEEDEVALGATPVLDDAISDLLRPQATPVSEGRNPGTSRSSTDAKIDALLAQMTACWSTGDPARFIPLLSADFRDSFLGGTEAEQAETLSSLQAAMQVPIVWERAGDVTETDDNKADAVVRTTAAGQEEFVRYLFVFEDGEWKWDGSASG